MQIVTAICLQTLLFRTGSSASVFSHRKASNWALKSSNLAGNRPSY
jgi:hypothetical protein